MADTDFEHLESSTAEGGLIDDAAELQSEESGELRNPPVKKEPSKPDLDFLTLHPFVRQTVLNKVYGCLIGSALGDTIGLFTEFLSKDACETIYKDRKPFSLVHPVTEWHPDTHRTRFEFCAWTDDTDQSLLILLSFLHNQASPDVFEKLPQDFADRLQIWIEQGLRALDRPPCGIGALVGSVVSNEAYLTDPAHCATQRWIKTNRRAAPNGSLMRTHPIGVISVRFSEEKAFRLAANVGRTTHVDPRCVVSCCISVGLLRGMLRGEILVEEAVDEAIERAYRWVLLQPELMNPGLGENLTASEIERHLERKEFERHVYALSLGELKLDARNEMGYVYKCLGSALLSLRLAMRSQKVSPITPHSLFEEITTDLIMEGGDADTNGAAAGALLGAYLGYSNLPHHWSNGLAHKDWLMSKIERLSIALNIIEGNVAERQDEAPDGGRGLMNKDQLEARDAEIYSLIMQRTQQHREKEEGRRKQAEKAKGLAGWFGGMR